MRVSIPSVALALLASLDLVSAHMEMTWPPPLQSKHNSFTTNVDYDMVNPLNADGSNFPCKGYLNLLGTKAATPVTTFKAGESYSLSIGGGANHNGGSCQASLSFDGGKTFTVIKSFLGGCPPPGSSSWEFTVPADTPSKTDAIFAWTWFNRIGNREMYMNCAVVSTEGAGAATNKQVSLPFSRRPGIFVANVANGCSTTEGSDVQFPNPGPEVDREGSQFLPPSGGTCGAPSNSGGGSANSGGSGSGSGSGNGSGNGSGSGSGNPNPAVPPSTPTRPPTWTTSTLPGGIFLPRPTTTLATVTRPTGSAGGDDTAATTRPDFEDSDRPAGFEKPGVPCHPEGLWNCVAGYAFQRCASGVWSVPLRMAAGTECRPFGLSNDFHIIHSPWRPWR